MTVAIPIEDILACFSNVVENNKKCLKDTTDCRDTQAFLNTCHSIFFRWAKFFSPQYLEQTTPTLFETEFKEFLTESGNGGWPMMKINIRDDRITANRVRIFELCREISSHASDPSVIAGILQEYGPRRRQKHISGMSEYHWSAVAFAANESVNMIIDGPVKEYFAYKFQIASDRVIDRYSDVVNYSQKLLGKFPLLRMWHVNKAYAVCLKGGYIKLKPLNKKVPLADRTREVMVSTCCKC